MIKRIVQVSLLMIFFICGTSLASDENQEIQMLLSAERQKELGFDRQRKMYPLDRAKRLSRDAVNDGWRLMRENKLDLAMAEFNRAWRFDPNQYGAWYGAGIIRWKQVQAAKKSEDVAAYCKDVIALFGKALELAPAERKIYLQSDLAQGCTVYAAALIMLGKKSEAESLLLRGKELLEALRKQFPDNGRFHDLSAVNAFYRGDYALAQREIAEAERCKFPVNPKLKANVAEKLQIKEQTHHRSELNHKP